MWFGKAFPANAASPARGDIGRWFINLSGRSLSDEGLPADYLKIDGSFVRRMLSEDLDYTMVQAIARIGHSAGMRIIA